MKRQVRAKTFFPWCSVSILAILVSGAFVQGAYAQTASATDNASTSEGRKVDEVVVNGHRTAEDLAATSAPLTATEPQTVISGDFIAHSVPRTGDFDSIFALSPSVGYGGSPNGPGSGESTITLRGFQDGEYNITYDDVPFSDTDTATHHSTSFWPISTIGSARVDRGPGNASQLGQASFGGSVNLYSPDVIDKSQLEAAATYGSFGTTQFIGGLQTGTISQLNGTKILFTGQSFNTAGYLTHSPENDQNQYMKLEAPITPQLTATLVLNHNTIDIAAPNKGGATLAQVAANGINFALSENPLSPTYAGYNFIHKETNFDIFTLNYNPGGIFTIKNQFYFYTYRNNTHSAQDVSGATPNTTKAGPAGNIDVPGILKLSDYYTYGDIIKAVINLGFGKLTTGLLAETDRTHRYTHDIDLTLNVPDPREKTAPFTVNSEDFSGYTQYQPFAEFEWKPVEALTITPGIKYVDFLRYYEASVSQVIRVPLNATETYTDTLPFLTVNYRLAPTWSVYGQYAQGLLAPPLNVFYVLNSSLATPKPQTSTNYQIGSVFNSKHLSLDADVYYIDFKNKIVAIGSGNDQEYTNVGGAIYKGYEGQITYAFDGGLAIFANGSRNSAISTITHAQLANAPEYTVAAGTIYSYRKLNFSLTDKINGDQYAVSGLSQYKIKAFDELDANIGYQITPLIKMEFGVYNLLDSKSVTSIAQSTASVNPTTGLSPYDRYSFQAGRSLQGTLRAKF